MKPSIRSLKPKLEETYLVTRAANDGADEVLCCAFGGVDVGLEGRSVVVGSRHVCMICRLKIFVQVR